MTEKLARRGTPVRTEYEADHLAHVIARDVASTEVVCLRADEAIAEVREWLDTAAAASHQGFPVVDAAGLLVGVVTRRDLLSGADVDFDGLRRVRDVVRRPPAVVFGDNTLREVADLMVTQRVGRLPVVERGNPRRVVGILSRSDLISAHAPRIAANQRHGRSSATAARESSSRAPHS
jgi:CBS domain-containing protein